MRKAVFAAAMLLAPHIAHGQSVTGLLNGVTGTVSGIAGGVGGTVGGVGGAVGGIVGGVGSAAGGALGGVGSAVGSVTGGTSGPATTASISGAGPTGGGIAGVGPLPSIALPAALAPCDDLSRRRGAARAGMCGARYTALFPDVGQVSGTREDLARFRIPLQPRGGTPQQIVQNCRQAIVASALSYGVVRVDAASAGPMRSARGGFAAPVEFRIIYNRQGGLETRQATINCRLNTAGRVISAA